ncbi:MAG TPA: MFS transporter [Burkholderiales bacterium]|nr:MFS transporter [Burkholderiales bacterium]
MPIYLIVLVTVLTHTSFKGSKVLIALFAIDLGASPLTIGVLFSMYSVFPVVLSVWAGKLSDRYGYRAPMLFGACGLAVGLLLPFALPALPTLFASAVLAGSCYIFYTVSVQHLIGSMGEGAARTKNYSIFSLGVGFTALMGPTTAGFAIDALGHRATYLLLGAIVMPTIAALVFFPSLVRAPPAKHKARGEQHFMDMLRDVPLRRLLITTGIIETGFELYNFFLPIYAKSLGMSASLIGLVMAGFAVALLAVRTVMPRLVRHSSEERVLSGSLWLAVATCLVFPFASGFASLLAASFVLGLGLGCCSPLSLVLAYNRSPPGRSGEAIGVRQTVAKITEVTMPIVFGSLGTVLGMGPVFWIDAAMLAVGAWLMARDAASRLSRPTDAG